MVLVVPLQEEILTMRQFDCAYVLPMYTAFVKNSDVYVISPLMCYNSCRDIMNTYFTTGNDEPFICLHSLRYHELKEIIAFYWQVSQK